MYVPNLIPKYFIMYKKLTISDCTYSCTCRAGVTTYVYTQTIPVPLIQNIFHQIFATMPEN